MKKMINRFFSGLKRALGIQETISVVYVAIMLLPNLFLAVTEPYSWSTVLGSILLPATFYLLVSVSLPRPGGVMLCTLPLMILGAFQIVLLYLFGGSIIAVDMFTNLFTTNASEAGELLANIWPAVVFVCVIYIPLLVLGVRSLVIKRRLSGVFRRRALWAAAASFVLGVIFVLVSTFAHPGFGVKYHVFPINVIYNIDLTLDRWSQSEAYPETSRDFRFDVTRSRPAGRRPRNLCVRNRRGVARRIVESVRLRTRNHAPLTAAGRRRPGAVPRYADAVQCDP